MQRRCIAVDRNVKENFEPVHPEQVLAKLVAMPIASLNFQGIRSGTAQSRADRAGVHAASGLGPDDTTIASGNLHGVALAAIQGLHAKLEAKVAQQAREIAEMRAPHAAKLAALRESIALSARASFAAPLAAMR